MTNIQALYEDLVSGKLDFASFSRYKGKPGEGILFQKLEPSYMIAMMKNDDPLAEKDFVTLNDLYDRALIQTVDDEYSMGITLDILRENRAIFRNVINTSNIETVPSVIRSTRGVYIAGENCRKQKAAGIAYKDIKGRDMVCDFGIAYLEQDNPLINIVLKELKLWTGRRAGGNIAV